MFSKMIHSLHLFGEYLIKYLSIFKCFQICFQIIAAPFVAGALFFEAPGAFFSLIPGYIIGKRKISMPCLE